MKKNSLSYHIWSISDLHLSFGVPNKSMDVFGKNWLNHHEKIKQAWIRQVKPEDLVLLAGDLSWATKPEEVKPDLLWIEELPGTKVLIRGNHDYWWQSASKVRSILPPSIHAIHHDTFSFKGISIGGTRLWDSHEYNFDSYVEYKNFSVVKEKKPDFEKDQKIFSREVDRLHLSLKQLDEKASLRLVMTHYPPIGPEMKDSIVSKILEHYKIDICVFGHLHNVIAGTLPFGIKNSVQYLLTSCDYLNFSPIKIL